MNVTKILENFNWRNYENVFKKIQYSKVKSFSLDKGVNKKISWKVCSLWGEKLERKLGKLCVEVFTNLCMEGEKKTSANFMKLSNIFRQLFFWFNLNFWNMKNEKLSTKSKKAFHGCVFVCQKEENLVIGRKVFEKNIHIRIDFQFVCSSIKWRLWFIVKVSIFLEFSFRQACYQ